MRLPVLLFLFLIFSAGVLPALAQEGTPAAAPKEKSEAEKFFDQCVAKPVVSTKEETDIAFCACAAERYQLWLSTPQKAVAKEIFQPQTTKELNKETLLSVIYGPCLYIPVYDLTYDKCFDQRYKSYFTGDPSFIAASCQCVAEGESLYYEKFMQPFLELKISEGAKIDDPIKLMERDPSYFEAHYQMSEECFTEWSRKEYEYSTGQGR